MKSDIKMFLKVGLASAVLFFIIHSFADAPVAASQPASTASAAAVVQNAASASAPIASMSLGDYIKSHGLPASAIMLLLCLNAILSGLRDLCAKLDGVKPGDAAPAGDVKLSMLNKACLILGKILDYLTANVQH